MTKIDTITIPKGVEVIGNYAFAHCSIKLINIPENVKSIGQYVFYKCTSLEHINISNLFNWCGLGFDSYESSPSFYAKNLYYNGERISDLVIPDGVTKIGSYVFSYNHITSLVVSRDVQYIAPKAFSGAQIKSVVWNAKSYGNISSSYKSPFDINNGLSCSVIYFGEEVENIPDYLLYGTNITSINIPKRVVSIGQDAFTSSKISKVIWNAKSYKQTNGKSPFYTICKQIKSFEFGDDVDTIPSYLCKEMPLTSVTIPINVTCLEFYAFQLCSEIKSVTWNAKKCITNDLSSPFYSSKLITTFEFGNDVEYVPAYLCYGLEYISKIVLQNKIIEIGDAAFENCKRLNEVTLSNNITTIKPYLFSGCTNLQRITIPNSVITIQDYAFNKCTKLYQISFGSNLREIGFYSFSGCSYVQNINIPNSVTTIQDNAFADCTNLSKVIWNAKKCNDFSSYNSAPFYNVRGQITSFTFGDEVEYIPAYLCFDMTNVPEIVIPNCKIEIGKNALYNCNYKVEGVNFTILPSVIVCPNGTYCDISGVTKSISESYTDTCIFTNILGCDSIVTREVIIKGTQAPIITIAGETDTLNTGKIWITDFYTSGYLGDDDFQAYYDYFTLNGVRYNHTAEMKQDGGEAYLIKPIYEDYFHTHNDYSTPIAPARKGKICDYSISGLASGDYTLIFYSEGCDSIVKKVNIPKLGMYVDGNHYKFIKEDNNNYAEVTYCGESYGGVHDYNRGTVTIPEKVLWQDEYYDVTSIGDHAYHNAYYLSEIILPNSITEIEYNAFYGCSGLTSVTIPYSVTRIGYSAFENCNNLKSVTMESATPPFVDKSSFRENQIIYVPLGSLATYKSTTWKNFDLRVFDMLPTKSESMPTSINISFGDNTTRELIASCGMEGGEAFEGNAVEYIGLEPNSEYKDVPFFIKTTKDDYMTTTLSFTTSPLTLTTQPAKAVSNNTAILLAETNMADIETSCGFEWRRNDQPEDMASNQVLCPVANGLMAGRLKGLKDDVYYKYRAFYKSAAGNMYYGDWQYIFTGDVAVEFDPILYTYEASNVQETQARLRGYALAGSDDFTEQGFEYWADSRAPKANSKAYAPQAAHENIGERHTVQASGISMAINLQNLDAGTVYHYRTYAKIGSQTLYGAEMSFTTKGEYTPPTYTILFVNYDGSPLLTLSEVEHGTMPVYTGDTPVRDEDAQYTYTFNGWAPEIVPATADATYTATYTATPKTSGIEHLDAQSAAPRKVIENGNLYIILPDGKKYDAGGKLTK